MKLWISHKSEWLSIPQQKLYICNAQWETNLASRCLKQELKWKKNYHQKIDLERLDIDTITPIALSLSLSLIKLFPVGCRCILLQRGQTFTSTKTVYPVYDTRGHLTVRPWKFGEYEVPLHCHYSHVHSSPEW